MQCLFTESGIIMNIEKKSEKWLSQGLTHQSHIAPTIDKPDLSSHHFLPELPGGLGEDRACTHGGTEVDGDALKHSRRDGRTRGCSCGG